MANATGLFDLARTSWLAVSQGQVPDTAIVKLLISKVRGLGWVWLSMPLRVLNVSPGDQPTSLTRLALQLLGYCILVGAGYTKVPQVSVWRLAGHDHLSATGADGGSNSGRLGNLHTEPCPPYRALAFESGPTRPSPPPSAAIPPRSRMCCEPRAQTASPPCRLSLNPTPCSSTHPTASWWACPSTRMGRPSCWQASAASSWPWSTTTPRCRYGAPHARQRCCRCC